jgi:tetraacyldisaccharide 4'-kinase
MLPAGRLRETPVMSKNRAHAIVLTRCPGKDGSGDQKKDGASQKEGRGQQNISSQYDGIPFFKTYHIPYLLKLLSRKKSPGAILPCSDSLKDLPCLLFSGIANHKSFKEAAEELGVNVVDHLEFKDHYRYKRADILWIQKRAEEIGAELIATTEKDWVKLGRDIQWNTDLAVIGIKIKFENDKAFEGFIKSRLDGALFKYPGFILD